MSINPIIHEATPLPDSCHLLLRKAMMYECEDKGQEDHLEYLLFWRFRFYAKDSNYYVLITEYENHFKQPAGGPWKIKPTTFDKESDPTVSNSYFWDRFEKMEDTTLDDYEIIGYKTLKFEDEEQLTSFIENAKKNAMTFSTEEYEI